MKKLAGGKQSLYLDIYENGNRSYEFLQLYLLPDTTQENQSANAITLKQANDIKSKRLIELTTGLVEPPPIQPNKVGLLQWMEQYKNAQEKRGKKDGRQIDVAIKILQKWAGNNVTLDQIDRKFCQKYIDYLMTEYHPKGKALSNNTLHNYYRVVNGALNAAVREELIKSNPFTLISSSDKIKKPESKREYMTLDEIKALIATPMKNENIKKAYLFSCFCGLRMSDIIGLTWKSFFFDGQQPRLEIVMQKTKAPIYLPLSKEAMRWMPERGKKSPDDKVFDLPTATVINVAIKPWAKKAGINKHFTFHTARHTFATMMLTLGADLYTTSKLMGHTDVRMTQVYAKIVNSKKDEAVNLVNGLFD